MVPDLTKLANEAGSDKGNEIFHAHDYTKLYSFIFEDRRLDPFSMLEIGLHRGGVDMGHLLRRSEPHAPSAKMWLTFFPNAFLYGFDISDFHSVKLDRFRFIQGDMGSLEHLAQLRNLLPPLRIIVDDGSHAAYHQQLALIKLFPLLEPGGYYVIEDLHAGHPIEQELPTCRKTRDIMEDYLASRRLDIPFVSDDERSFVESNIRKTFVHRNDRGGVNHWTMKLVAFERR